MFSSNKHLNIRFIFFIFKISLNKFLNFINIVTYTEYQFQIDFPIR